MVNKTLLLRFGISVLFFLSVATFFSVFEIEDKPKKQKRLKNYTTQSTASSSAALLVRPSLSIGKPERTTKLEEKSEDDDQLVNSEENVNPNENFTLEQGTLENINKRSSLQNPEDSTKDTEPFGGEQNEELKESIKCLELELEKQKSYVISERQAKLFVENQLKVWRDNLTLIGITLN